MVSVSNEYGEVSITIDGFEIDKESMNLIKEGYGFEDSEKNQEIGIIKKIWLSTKQKCKNYWRWNGASYPSMRSWIII